MNMLIILIIQILLFIFICCTFEYKNNIWYVLMAVSAIIPIMGIITIIAVAIPCYIEAFDYCPSVYIKDNKINRWLYAGYFNK